MSVISSGWANFSYATRNLMRRPFFAIATVSILAIGISACGSVFTLINTILVRPLPFSDFDRLFFLDGAENIFYLYGTNTASFMQQIVQVRSVESSSAFDYGEADFTGQGEPEKLLVMRATPNIFSVLRIPMVRGNTSSWDNPSINGKSIVILTERCWRRKFSLDPEIIGKMIQLNGESRTIVGIAKDGVGLLVGGGEVSGLIPLTPGEDFFHTQSVHYEVICRIRHDFESRTVQDELKSLNNLLREGRDQANTQVRLIPLREKVVGKTGYLLFLLSIAVGVVFVVICADVSALFLARGVERKRELAIMAAMGAGRICLVMVCLTESLLVSMLGGCLGFGLNLWLVGSLLPELLLHLQQGFCVVFDGTVAAFFFAISLLAGVVAGIAPAVRLSFLDLNELLKDSGPGNASRRVSLGLGILLGVEVAAAVTLLIGGGCVIGSLYRLVNVSPGFQSANLTMIDISLPGKRFLKPEEKIESYERILDDLKTMKSVKHAGFVYNLPFDNRKGRIQLSLAPVGVSSDHLARKSGGLFNVVSPDYFRAMGIPLKRGRPFRSGDRSLSPPVIILSESLSEKLFEDGAAIGSRISIDGGEDREVIGIVGDTRQFGLNLAPKPEFYLCHLQSPSDGLTLVLKTDGTSQEAVETIKAAVWRVDRLQPVNGILEMDDLLASSFANWSLISLLLGIFALLSCLVATIGVYGITSYTVKAKRQAFAIHEVFGADGRRIFFHALSLNAWPILLGAIAGLVASSFLIHGLAAYMFMIDPIEPVIFCSAALAVIGASFLISAIPSVQISRQDIMKSLKGE